MKKPRISLREELRLEAQKRYPRNPFCPSWVSTNLVREVLEEAGHKNFRLVVTVQGIFIEGKG